MWHSLVKCQSNFIRITKYWPRSRAHIHTNMPFCQIHKAQTKTDSKCVGRSLFARLSTRIRIRGVKWKKRKLCVCVYSTGSSRSIEPNAYFHWSFAKWDTLTNNIQQLLMITIIIMAHLSFDFFWQLLFLQFLPFVKLWIDSSPLVCSTYADMLWKSVCVWEKERQRERELWSSFFLYISC